MSALVLDHKHLRIASLITILKVFIIIIILIYIHMKCYVVTTINGRTKVTVNVLTVIGLTNRRMTANENI